jgi:hypothetical protein
LPSLQEPIHRPMALLQDRGENGMTAARSSGACPDSPSFPLGRSVERFPEWAATLSGSIQPGCVEPSQAGAGSASRMRCCPIPWFHAQAFRHAGRQAPSKPTTVSFSVFWGSPGIPRQAADRCSTRDGGGMPVSLRDTTRESYPESQAGNRLSRAADESWRAKNRRHNLPKPLSASLRKRGRWFSR